MNDHPLLAEPATICFGLNRETDLQSLAAYLRKFAAEDLMATLLPRFSEQDINDTVSFLTALLKKHLSEQEYHRIFLGSDQ